MEDLLEPPWEKFDYDRYDMGWRMGKGEDYLMEWAKWYYQLSEGAQTNYQSTFPEPKEWKGFYDE
nr:hypothetical protein [uncultured Arsenicibacter sp.]